MRVLRATALGFFVGAVYGAVIGMVGGWIGGLGLALLAPATALAAVFIGVAALGASAGEPN